MVKVRAAPLKHGAKGSVHRQSSPDFRCNKGSSRTWRGRQGPLHTVDGGGGGGGIRDLFLAGKKQDLKEGFKDESGSSRPRGRVDGEGILDRGKTSFKGTEV